MGVSLWIIGFGKNWFKVLSWKRADSRIPFSLGELNLFFEGFQNSLDEVYTYNGENGFIQSLPI